MLWYLNNYGRDADLARSAYEIADDMLKARDAAAAR